MTQKFNNILEIKDNFDVFLFDAYGVFWDGSDFYGGAKDTMEQLVKEGKIVYVLSNTTAISEDSIKSYDKKGLVKGVHYTEMVTSGEAARDAIRRGDLIFAKNPEARKVYQFGTPNKKLFDGTDYVNVGSLSEAELIYISIPQFTEDEYNSLKGQYGKFLSESKLPKEGDPRKWDSTIIDPFTDKLKELFKSGLPIVNANPDYIALEGVKGEDRKVFAVRQGYIAEVLRKSGAEVIEYGKPHKEIYDFTLNLLVANGVNVSDRSRICMIGDTLRTDIRGANNAGIKSVLCVETGNIAADIKSGKSLDTLVKEEGVVVDYTIKGVAINSKFENVNNEEGKSMTDKFELVPGLAKKDHIMNLKLSTVLFEDNKYYPWVFLVPMKPNIKNMTYLAMDDRLQLMKEMAIVEKAMATLFEHTQTNVAMIGNKTPQLHVHILTRKEGDPDWPGTVWGNAKEPYAPDEKTKTIAKIKAAIEAEMKKPEYKY